jgi:hypothetical protein
VAVASAAEGHAPSADRVRSSRRTVGRINELLRLERDGWCADLTSKTPNVKTKVLIEPPWS